MTDKLSIIIIHYNTPNLLRKQLSNFKDNKNLEIIIIDNSNCLDKNNFAKNVKLITNSYNRGFSFACNQGASLTTEWLFFLNPDVLVTPQELKEIVRFAQVQKLDALSPSPQSTDYQKPTPSVFSLINEFLPIGKIFGFKILSKFLNHKKTLTGGALLIKKKVLQNLGGWDERFFLWFEDSDLTHRLLDAKYKIGFYPHSVEHLGGQSFKKMPSQVKKDIFFNSLDIYAHKHFNFLGKQIVKLIKLKYTRNKIISSLNKGLISLIIPNLKLELLNKFLKNNLNFINFDNTELIIVSSGLNYKNIWQYRKKYPQIRFIPIDINKGFADTVNIGMKVASGDFVGTVNDDVVLSKNWLKKLLKKLPKSTGSINPIILNQNRQIESAGIKILIKGKAEPITDISKQKINSVDATNAACVIYTKESLIRTGIFDEKFGSYLEDIDLSLRLKKAGFKNIINSDIKIFHVKHSTSKAISLCKAWLDFKNWWLVIIKNWTLKDLILNLPAICLERMKNLSGLIKAFT